MDKEKIAFIAAITNLPTIQERIEFAIQLLTAVEALPCSDSSLDSPSPFESKTNCTS
jgi:hypothetical protein